MRLPSHNILPELGVNVKELEWDDDDEGGGEASGGDARAMTKEEVKVRLLAERDTKMKEGT